MSRLLIVDDNPVGYEILTALLDGEGYEFIPAENGLDAIRLAGEARPDLILLDVLLPDLNGYEVCRRLRADPDLAKIPVMMITSLDDRASRLEGIRAGADDFITRPYDSAELIARVRSITRINRYRSLLEERARFEQLINLSPDGILILTGDQKIRVHNPAFREMVGISQLTVLDNCSLAGFIPEDEQAALSQAIQGVTSRRLKALRVETRLNRVDGTSFPADLSLGAIDWDGQACVQIMVHDTTARMEVEERLRVSQQTLRRLAARLNTIREEQSQIISREIHDEFGQSLTGLKMELFWLNNRLEELLPAREQARRVKEKGREMMGLVDALIQQVRRISTELRPVILDDGLVATIEWQARDFQNRYGITCVFNPSLEALDMPGDRATALFRIVQEALTNVARHAGATQVVIDLEEQGQSLRLAIRDNGRGMPTRELRSAKTLGLVGMRERALAFDGTVQITSAPGGGTTVEVMMPVQSTWEAG